MTSTRGHPLLPTCRTSMAPRGTEDNYSTGSVTRCCTYRTYIMRLISCLNVQGAAGSRLPDWDAMAADEVRGEIFEKIKNAEHA